MTFQPEETNRAEANRANAQLSTGPRTPEGKAKSSLNALKSALTGRTVLLPSEDAALYHKHIHAFRDHYWPVDEHECVLVQSLADLAWRLARIPVLEMALFAKGRLEFAALFPEEPLKTRPALLDTHTLIVYEKQLRNLHLQESRLRRRQEKEIAALLALQKERTDQQDQAREDCANMYLAAKQDRRSFDPARYGFEFSIEEIELYLECALQRYEARDRRGSFPHHLYPRPETTPKAA
jgi:hypothetical protein